MTKRKIKNHGPVGHNKSLGNSLVNKQKESSKRSHNPDNPNILEEKEPQKVIDSVTHESNLTEFLTNAELAGTNFEAQRGDIRVLSKGETNVVKVQDLKKHSLEELNQKYGHLLRIPRRPLRGMYTTADELHKLENESFLNWKRSLSLLSEGSDVVLTPFERNLELWRQLWRVIERSDIVVQIVDARNPLLFRSSDLEAYVKEVDSRKKSIILVNKSDLLTHEQIQEWHKYFVKNGIAAVFWSATQSANEKQNSSSENDSNSENVAENFEKSIQDLSINSNSKTAQNYNFIKSSKDLFEFFKREAKLARPDLDSFVIGMVGYPNVGKSSTINCLIGEKKTSVSATPGKTKHFQTLIMDEELTLCDCPGLVMPSFGFSTSEMILNAVLPIHHMRDHFSPIQVLCNRIPRRQFEALYSVLLPKPASHEPSDRPPTAHELLTTVAFMKGFMSSRGIPDCSRAARMILNDVIAGVLKWIASPPGVPQEKFDQWTVPIVASEKKSHIEYGENLLKQLDKRNLIINDESTNLKVNSSFFGVKTAGAGRRGPINGTLGTDTISSSKKHNNRNKKEKLRRVFAHLDA